MKTSQTGERKSEEERLIERLLRNSFLSEYLDDENITDISFNGTDLRIQDNSIGRYKPKEQPNFDDVFHLGKKIADIQGKEWTNSQPLLNTELAYFRVNFIHDSVSPSGCTFSIRVSKPKLVTTDLADFANDDVAKLLSVLIQAEFNLIIAGRTGSGKTEFQKLLAGHIDNSKKITLIEDTMDSHIKELYPEKDINSWRTLIESSRENQITYHDLIKEGLRNNPDWLIIAETRGSEAYDMLESALTDHAIITTIHAKGAGAIPSRLLSMVGQRFHVNEILLGQDIVNTLKIGIHLTMEYTEDGIKRFIREIVEFTNFSVRGVEYTPLYKIEKDFDKRANQYTEVIKTNPLSEESISNLMYKGLVHLVPKVFLERRDEK
ncbi:CpaF/VirB11 family protein [Lentibacillus sp. N15]|uniref:CpaF/VirB11 family protein n=1 Tax=Lentibacillus songyuanensis TaxID=3136161 RepID=UPI0031B9F96D